MLISFTCLTCLFFLNCSHVCKASYPLQFLFCAGNLTNTEISVRKSFIQFRLPKIIFNFRHPKANTNINCEPSGSRFGTMALIPYVKPPTGSPLTFIYSQKIHFLSKCMFCFVCVLFLLLLCFYSPLLVLAIKKIKCLHFTKLNN